MRAWIATLAVLSVIAGLALDPFWGVFIVWVGFRAVLLGAALIGVAVAITGLVARRRRGLRGGPSAASTALVVSGLVPLCLCLTLAILWWRFAARH